MNKTPKAKPCKNPTCDNTTTWPSGVCSLPCANIVQKIKEGKKAAQIAKREALKSDEQKEFEASIKKRDKEAKKKKQNKTTPQLVTILQGKFNKYIRLVRDKDKPCYTCGDPNPKVKDEFGGVWDCGHCVPVSRNGALRFDEDNVAKQCKTCNGSWGGGGMESVFKDNILRDKGQQVVDKLYRPYKPFKYNRDEILAKIKYYEQKNKEAGL